MESAWGTDTPVRAADFPGPGALEQQFRHCRCGQFTFLPLPCRNCGSDKTEPAFRYALRRAKAERRRRWLFAVPFLAVTCVLAGLIWLPLAVAPPVVVLAALLGNSLHHSDELDICYWLFHDGAKGRPPMAEPAAVERITNAYDADLRRLEQMLDQDSSPECAKRVYPLAGEMAALFHNRRVSALLMRCLLALPMSEGVRVDVDQVCAFLEPEDLPDQAAALLKLADCANFTCLPMGRPTARFVGRVCARRVQADLSGRSELGEVTVAEASRTASARLDGLFTPAERTALTALWDACDGGLALGEDPSQTANPKPEDDVPLSVLPAHSGAVASCWYRQAWFIPNSAQRQALTGLLQAGAPAEHMWEEAESEWA